MGHSFLFLRCFRLVWFLAQLPSAVAAGSTSSTCLPKGVPLAERKNVTVDGKSQPLGIWVLTWQSATMIAHILKLTSEEVLGFNAVMTGASPTVPSGMWAIAGCLEPAPGIADEAQALRSSLCNFKEGEAFSTTHLNVETWNFYLPATLKSFEKPMFSKRRPALLGDLGYQGKSRTFIPDTVFEAGLKDGMIMHDYVAYNSSRFQPEKYFASVDQINTTAFFKAASKCKDYAPMNSNLEAADYLRHFPWDPDGVERYTVMEDGQQKNYLRANCPDGVWWLSPKCRENRTRCLPWISFAGYGWMVMWHKAVVFDMAVAMACTDEYWTGAVTDAPVINYMWRPDATFSGQRPIMFPGFMRDEHADGYYATEFAQVKTEKWAHRDLATSAPRLWTTVSRMSMSDSKIQEMLDYKAANASLTWEETACYFMLNNEDIWSQWVPSRTSCEVGQGLTTSAEGEYSCEWCTRTTHSVAGSVTIGNTSAPTRYCEACPAGEHGSYSTDSKGGVCFPCAEGTMTDKEGSEECSRCKLGTYQTQPGSTACTQCPDGRTTRVESATAQAECVCKEGTFEPEGVACASSSDSCECITCMEGLDCVVGSSLSDWKARVAGTAGAEDGIVPQVGLGYYSLKADPESIYRCAEEVACPGGDPESCAGGRFMLACTRCPDTHYLSSSDRICKRCDGSGVWILFLAFPIGWVFLTMAHIIVNFPIFRSSRTMMTAVFLCGMALTTVLTFNIYANMAIVAEPPLSDMFAILKIFAFDLEILKFSCFAGTDSQVSRYLFKLLGVPFAFGILTAGAGIARLLPRVKNYANFNLVSLCNSMGLLFSVSFITVSLMSMEAFRCESHPNGKSSLTSDRSIVCWEGGDHSSIVAMSTAAIMVYPLPFLSLTGFLTYMYIPFTRRFGSSYTHMCRFLFNRMSPDYIHFGFWYNMRNFFLTLVPVVAVNHYSAQVFLLMVIFVSWLTVQLFKMPWRFSALNTFDAFTSSLQILMLTCFAMLSGGGSKEDNVAATAGWAIICLFMLIIISLFVGAGRQVYERFSRQKEFGIFLSHAKEGAGVHARLFKLMLNKTTTRKVFLDTDDLMDLDNINFTVRSSIDNLLLMVSSETLGRMWVAMEIASAFTNDVPIHVVHLSQDAKPFTEEQLIASANSWSALDIAEFNKVGVEVVHIEAAYRHLQTLPHLKFSATVSDAEQWESMKTILAANHKCPKKDYSWSPHPDHKLLIGFDRNSELQACTAVVLKVLFQEKRWTVSWITDVSAGSISANTVAVVLMSVGLQTIVEAIGFITMLKAQDVPVVTVLSGEDFTSLDEANFVRFGSTGATEKATADEWEMVWTYAPGSSGEDIKNAMKQLYRILALRFAPKQSEMVMRSEFQRIQDRLDAESTRRYKFGVTSPMSSLTTVNKVGSTVSLTSKPSVKTNSGTASVDVDTSTTPQTEAKMSDTVSRSPEGVKEVCNETSMPFMPNPEGWVEEWDFD